MEPNPYIESEQEKETRENNFTYHKPIGSQPTRYENIRHSMSSLAEMLNEFCPPSRERSLAMTKLEEACFWANAAIARNETQTPRVTV